MQWGNDEYGAAAFKKAIKGDRVGGTQSVYVVNSWRHLGEQTKAVASDWFAEMVSHYLATTPFGPTQAGPLVFIPFPGSKIAVGVSHPPFSPYTLAMKLSARLAQQRQASQVVDVLRWDQPRPSTREPGGSRDPEDLYPHLMVTGPMPPGQVFLVDDVCTGGGHLRAAVTRLKEHGVHVEHALCAVKAESNPQQDYFKPTVHTYPDLVPGEGFLF